MANFLPMNSSPFGQMNLYTPDWSFLTTVMGTKQAEYDRGFNIAKSHYDYLRYTALTNPENMEQREYAFKQLENNIKSIANLDLSKGENISKALAVMNPISEDKAIVYDMAYTKAMDSERSRMEAIKNSTDPEVRKTYNRYSEMEMGYADLNMQEAHRNDGSIFEIKPVKHVMYRDYIGDLDKKMKDAGISIKASNVTGDGYIIETKNGPMSIPYFNLWAQMQMGDQYDEQFAVMGRVQTETAIRNTMDTDGVDRKSAQAYVAERLAPILADKEAQKTLAYDEAYRKASLNMNIFKKEYPGDKFPASKKAEYDAIKNEMLLLETASENAALEEIKLRDPSYILSNMSYYFGNSAKDQHIQEWASSTAMATMEESINTDDTWIAKMKEAGLNSRHKDNMDLELYKLNTTMEYNKAKDDIKQNPDGSFQKSTTSSSTIVGTSVSDQTLFKIDMLHQNKMNAENKTYNAVVDSDDSLLSLLLQINAKEGDPNILSTLASYQQLLGNLNEYANSASGSYIPYFKFANNSESMQLLTNMIVDLELGIGVPQMIHNKGEAKEYLTQLNVAIYNKASQIIKEHPDKLNVTMGLYNSLATTQESVENSLAVSQEIYNFWDEAAGIIQGNSLFHISPNKIIGYTPNKNPILDVSSFTEPQKAILENLISDSVISGVSASNIYSLNVTNPDAIGTLLNENYIKTGSFKGTGDYDDDLDDIIKGMFSGKNYQQIAEEFGNNIKATYDPVAKTYMFELKPGKPTNNTNKKYGSIQFKVDESVIASTGVLNDTYGFIRESSQLPMNIVGNDWAKLLNEPGFVKQSGEETKSMGFTWEIKKNNNNGYTALFNIRHPITQKWTQKKYETTSNIPEESLAEVKAVVNQFETKFIADKKIISDKQRQSEELIPYY